MLTSLIKLGNIVINDVSWLKVFFLGFKCFDIKKVKSLNDLISLGKVLGGKPTKNKNK